MPIIWNRVTWYSKLLALFLLILVFYLGFILGRFSVKVIDPEKAAGNIKPLPAGQSVEFNN